jgi:hypothetical protein
MVSNSSELSWFLVGTASCMRIAALAVASVIAAVSVATAAEPSEGALVESVSGKSLDVQPMDYVRVGQIIRLGPYGTIVLSYKASCVREMITSGIVTIGTEYSYVRSGEIRRLGSQCDTGRVVLTDADSHAAGKSFRGIRPTSAGSSLEPPAR